MPPLPDLDALFGIPNVFHWGGGVSLSPDGETLAFMWNKTGRWQIYTLPIHGGEARQVTHASEAVAAPRWSPDGKRIAYLQDYSGDENFDLFVLDPATGETHNLTPDTPDEAINWAVRWLPDGSGFVYVSNRDGNFATYLLARDGRSIRRLTQHEYSDLIALPSPDGRHIAIETSTIGQTINTLIVSLNGRESMWIGRGAERIDASMVDWSPDGKKIAFMSDARGGGDIGVFDLATRSVEWISDGAHECYTPVWSPDGRRVAYIENVDGDHGLVLHTLGGETRRIDGEPGLHAQLAFTPDGESIVYTFAGPDRPADLWRLTLASGQAVQLTDSLPSPIDRSAFVRPVHVYYPSLDDGVQVPALLYVPQDAQRDGSHPGVLYVHGGPTAQFDNDFVVAVQDLVMRGYVVLAPNYRGSTGYGKIWREANRFDIGRCDTNDVAAGADYLAREGWCSPDRIGVTGVSHGGYLTMTCLTFQPERFAAGSALVPYVNWFTEHANERADLQYWDLQNMGDPEKDRDRWRAMSPIFFIDRIRAPVQLFAGGTDPRCPPGEAEQVRQALQARGMTVELHLYSDEGHGFRKIANRTDAYKKRAQFLETHLRRNSQERL